MVKGGKAAYNLVSVGHSSLVVRRWSFVGIFTEVLMGRKLVFGLVGVGIFGVLVYGVLAWISRPLVNHPFFAHEGVMVIAHQGGDGLWPSNTMRAFQGAAELGVDVLEMDIHSTADGVLVVMHDKTVDRTTNGRGALQAMTLAELKTLDAGYNWSRDGGQTYPYRGQEITVPALAEIFAAFPGWRMNIEIKQADPPIVQPLCRMIRDNGAAERVLVASFHAPTIQAFRQECPGVATSIAEAEVRTFFALNLLYLGRVYQPVAQAVQVPEERSNLHILTPRFIRTAQRHNMDVHVWTVNETEDMERMVALGVNGIITDYPDRLLALLGRTADGGR
jgi:glycerophosphoryl diester phosphodiesterase